MNAQYYIWADGNEQGPMSMQHLMREWKSGNLPKGFLWRREDHQAFQAPDALENEQPTASPSDNLAVKHKQELTCFDYLWTVRNESQYKQLRFWLGLITISVGLSGFFLALTIGVMLAVEVKPIFGIIVGIIVAIISLSIAAAVDQGMRLAIDAVDVMIDRGRKGL